MVVYSYSFYFTAKFYRQCKRLQNFAVKFCIKEHPKIRWIIIESLLLKEQNIIKTVHKVHFMSLSRNESESE